MQRWHLSHPPRSVVTKTRVRCFQQGPVHCKGCALVRIDCQAYAWITGCALHSLQQVVVGGVSHRTRAE